jgi:hypothetical protein
MPPIRKALVALPLLLLLSLFLAPTESTADAREGAADGSGRPAAALVARADQGQAGTDEGGLGPFGLAALVGIGLVPTFVLISRRRQHRHLTN